MEATNSASEAQQVAADVIPAAFLQDPVVFLSDIAAKPQSLHTIYQLGGWMSKWFASKTPDKESSVAPAAAAYLQAASVHLQEGGMSGMNAHLEAAVTKARYEVVTTVGVCATLCQDRRAAITSSGILPTLAHLFLNNPTQSVNQLSLEGVEFLQCALLAGQYRYAARLVGGTWPRPDATVNVKQVLRYYYLRGMIHLGCNDFVMAHRCFWTCLSVPAEVCCKIAVEAWKKLVLVQCIMNDGNDPQSNGVDFPKCMPSCLLRMLWSSKEGTNNMSTTTPQNTPQELQLTSNPVLQVQPLIAQSQSSKQSPMNTESTACYMDLAAEFRRRNKSEVQSLIVKHKETYEEDGNFGLVQQCLTQLIHNQVRHISKMYSVVSLTKAASLLGISNTSDEATREQVATLLFQSGVPCEIQEDGMIVFYDSEDDSVALSSLVDLAEWMALIDRVQRLDVNILTSPRYQNLIRKEVSTGTASSGEAKAATAMSSGSRGVDNL